MNAVNNLYLQRSHKGFHLRVFKNPRYNRHNHNNPKLNSHSLSHKTYSHLKQNNTINRKKQTLYRQSTINIQSQPPKQTHSLNHQLPPIEICNRTSQIKNHLPNIQNAAKKQRLKSQQKLTTNLQNKITDKMPLAEDKDIRKVQSQRSKQMSKNLQKQILKVIEQESLGLLVGIKNPNCQIQSHYDQQSQLRSSSIRNNNQSIQTKIIDKNDDQYNGQPHTKNKKQQLNSQQKIQIKGHNSIATQKPPRNIKQKRQHKKYETKNKMIFNTCKNIDREPNIKQQLIDAWNYGEESSHLSSILFENSMNKVQNRRHGKFFSIQY